MVESSRLLATYGLMNHLGQYIRTVRLNRGVSPQEVASQIGYENTAKGARRILHLEQSGESEAALLTKVIAALALSQEGVEFAQALDHDKWLEQKNMPQPSNIIIRYSAGIYGHQSLPAEIETQNNAEAYASNIAAMQKVMVCLNWRGQHHSWVNREGKVYARTEMLGKSVNP